MIYFEDMIVGPVHDSSVDHRSFVQLLVDAPLGVSSSMSVRSTGSRVEPESTAMGCGSRE